MQSDAKRGSIESYFIYLTFLISTLPVMPPQAKPQNKRCFNFVSGRGRLPAGGRSKLIVAFLSYGVTAGTRLPEAVLNLSYKKCRQASDGFLTVDGREVCLGPAGNRN